MRWGFASLAHSTMRGMSSELVLNLSHHSENLWCNCFKGEIPPPPPYMEQTFHKWQIIEKYAFVLRISFYWINGAPLKLASQFKHSLNLDMIYAPFSKSSVFDQNSFNKLETSKNFWWMLSNSPVFAKALKYITVWWGRHAQKIHKCENEKPQVKQMWEQTKKCECIFL